MRNPYRRHEQGVGRAASFRKQSERWKEILYSPIPAGIGQSLAFAYRDLEGAKGQMEAALYSPDYDPPYLDGADKENTKDIIWTIGVAMKQLDSLVNELLDDLRNPYP